MLIGTTAYMSPEQARGVAVDERTDVWSLGVVLYEMLAGRAPFGGQTSSDVLAAILEREPQALIKEGPGVPDGLQRIVRKALQKDREKRYQTSKDLALDLESLRREMEAKAGSGTAAPINTAVPGSPAAARATRNRRAKALALAAVLLLAAAAIVGAWVWRSSNRLTASKTNPVTVETPAPPAAAGPERSLVYSILVQKYRHGRPFEAPFRLGGDINFEKDYRVRLNLRSPQDRHLYILNEGPAKSSRPSPLMILFPSPTANDGQSLLGAGRQVQIPERSWLQFDAEQGTEKIRLVWAADSIPALEAVKGFANPRDRGLIGDPELNDAVRDVLQAHQSLQPVAVRDEDRKEVVLTSNGAILTHLLKLEHH
jgi:hypothetical protein